MLLIIAKGDTLGFGYAWDDHRLAQLDLHEAHARSLLGLRRAALSSDVDR